MYYEPYEDEYAAVPKMDDEELLEYFLFRLIEADEVWGLTDGRQWVTRAIDGKVTMPVWPFRRFANEAAVGEWLECKPVPESIEFFLDQVLNKLAMQGIAVEIMPRQSGVGCLISPQRLFRYLEDMRESGACSVGD